MKVEILSEKKNKLLKRREVRFRIDHGRSGKTPPRLEVRKAIAAQLKTSENTVFVKEVRTKTGTQTAVGTANVYELPEQAKLTEPKYIVKRNSPPEKSIEVGKE